MEQKTAEHGNHKYQPGQILFLPECIQNPQEAPAVNQALILIHKPGHRPVRNPFVQLLRHRASVIVIHVGHGKAFISGIIPLACKFFRIKPQRVPGMMQELLR